MSMKQQIIEALEFIEKLNQRLEAIQKKQRDELNQLAADYWQIEKQLRNLLRNFDGGK